LPFATGVFFPPKKEVAEERMPSDPTSDERLRKAVLRGQHLLEKETYHDVVTWCQKVLAVYPDQPEILKQLETAQGALNKRLLDDIFSLAERALSQGDYDAALEQFQKVFDVDPENARAKERVAQINAMKEGAPAGGSVPPAGGSAPPAQPSKEAVEQPFGINVDDPFALGDEAAPPAPQEAPPAPAPEGQAEASGAEAVPADAGATPGASKELKIVDDISDALLTSERMHEAAEAFGAEVVDKPPPGMDFVVDEEKSAEDAALEAELESAALEGAPPAEETTADGAPASAEPPGKVEVPEPEGGEAAPSFELDESEAPASAEPPGKVEVPEPEEGEAAPSFELDESEAPASAESPGEVEMPEPQGGEAAPSLEPGEPEAPALEIDETPLELEEGGSPGKALPTEEQKHIEALSKKGDAYFERGQCQLAIDTWYQILLVDENNKAALRRIEKAKRELEMQGKKVTLDLPAQDVLETTDSAMTQEAMAEGPQQAITALLEDAKKLFEAGQYAASAEKCDHIIQIEPGHQEANRLIHDANLKIQGQEPKEAAQAEAAEAVSPGAFTPVAQQEIKIAAPPSSRAPLLLIGLMAVLLLIGGGLAAFFMWFAKPAPVEETQQVVAPKPKVPQPLPEPEPEPEPEPQVQSDAELLAARMEKAARLFKEAKAFFAKRKYAEAAAAIAESASLNPTNLEAIDFKEKADAALAASQEETGRYERAMKNFKERNYEEALRQFYRMKEVRYYSRELQETVARGWYSLQVEPEEVDAYIEKSWYNRGVVSLWDENSELTLEALREYLLLRPDDAEARKHLTVAERYSRRPKDENYRQYVSFLKLRE
jgi:tetratricopeptide (TPR) repeat protein